MAETQQNENVVQELLDKNLPAFFKSYENITPERPTAYLMWNDRGNLVKRILYVCHAQMKREDRGFTDMITAVPFNDPWSLDYLRMLIYGPFRAFAHMIFLERYNGLHYLRISDLDKFPANALFNFCVASRYPIESPHLQYWGELVTKGFEPTLAALLSWSTGGAPKSGLRYFPNDPHYWLDPASAWKNVLTGNMVRLSAPYADDPRGSTPSNIIWGESTDYARLIDMSDEAVAEFYGLPLQPVQISPKPKSRKKGPASQGAQGINFGPIVAQQAQNQAIINQLMFDDPQPHIEEGNPLDEPDWEDDHLDFEEDDEI